MDGIPLAGSKIRGWRLVRLLGVGPVSATYEAYSSDDETGEHVVLKLCTVPDKEAQSHFLRAVYAANRFRHPRVVPITHDGRDDHGAPFVIRPWLDARSLADTVAERDLTEQQVLRIGEQLLDALEMAHAHGITHGALTPHNLMLTPNGSIRLCDFAMAPGHGDAGADVWAVAACMYFGLAKKLPRREIADRAAPGERLSGVLPHISSATRAVLAHALMVDPKEGYESAYAMLGDVRRAMSNRMPKLALAEKPIPSGGYRALAALTPPLGQQVDTALARIGRPSMIDIDPRGQRLGNAALVIAIVTLVGVATFVMVREKMSDEPRRDSDAPAEAR